jgi:Tfp pilus assembly protein PilV
MAAMSVLLIGSLGLLSLHHIGVAMNGDARVMSRATAIAQDLVSQLQMWSFDDPRLANTNTTNDADPGDSAGAYETATFTFDQQESGLESQAWLGLPSATVQGLGFTRFWNVAHVDLDANGTLNAKRVAVIVRWQRNGTWRRIVLFTVLKNPASTN